MFDALVKNLKKHVPFHDIEITEFLLHFDKKIYCKGDLTIERGTICNHLYYINSGIVRCYNDLNNKETTLDLWCEDHWFSDYESHFLSLPSSLYFQALENTEVYAISYSSLEGLYTRGFNFEKWGFLMSQKRLMDFLKREIPERLISIDEYYNHYVNKNPEIIKRVPLKYIASMLGVEPETLSRIRKRLYK